MNKEKKEFKPISLDKLIDSLYFQFEVATATRMKTSDELKKQASILWWLEDLRELKNGSKRNGKVSKRAKGQGDGDSPSSKGEG